MKKLTFRKSLSIALVLLMLVSLCGYAAAVEPCEVHDYERTIIKAPTCTERGLAALTCKVCKTSDQQIIPALGHTWKLTSYAVEPTCIKSGIGNFKCSICGTTDQFVIAATGQHTEEVIPGYAATATEDGLTDGVKCSVCGKILVEQEVIPANSGTPVLPPVIDALLPVLGEQVASPFVDVAPMDYCFDAVNWAVENKITTGTGPLSFSPDEPCTRAQAVTFLWRASGSPTPENTTTVFIDVDASAYYYEAVLWAVEQGVTNGTSDVTFSPDAFCTRAQIVMFLYRAMGYETGTATVFTDVAPDAYYAPAVAWAAANAVTGGTTPTMFSPEAVCTRSQIVTFLYRACAN